MVSEKEWLQQMVVGYWHQEELKADQSYRYRTKNYIKSKFLNIHRLF